MPNIFPIETERLKLVPLDMESISPDDHQKIEQRLGLQLASMILGEQIDREIKAAMRSSLEDVIRSKKQDQWYADWQSVLIVLKEKNVIIGGFCFQRHADEDGTVQIGYTIRPEYQRHGYMTEALREGIAWIFQRPEISAVLAETTKSNVPSHKVLQNVGMTVCKETNNGFWWRLGK